MTHLDELPVYIITKIDVGVDDGVLFCEVKNILSVILLLFLFFRKDPNNRSR